MGRARGRKCSTKKSPGSRVEFSIGAFCNSASRGNKRSAISAGFKQRRRTHAPSVAALHNARDLLNAPPEIESEDQDYLVFHGLAELQR